MKGYVILEDGAVLEGKAFGSTAAVAGELCFHTEMAGYEDICNDPANSGQIVVMTYPIQGNCGFSREDAARSRTAPMGVIVRDYSEAPSHYRCEKTLAEYFAERNIFGLAFVDTRMIARRIARGEAVKCCLTTGEPHPSLIREHFRPAPTADGAIKETTRLPGKGGGVKAAVLDLGSNRGLLAQMEAEGAGVTLFPHTARSSEILAENPECLFVTHGGGDPRSLPHTVDTLRELVGKVKLYGVGMGALLLGAALGLTLFPLACGRRGANYPVMRADNGRVTLTSQNIAHGLRRASGQHENLQITYTCVNDGGIQGFRANGCEAVLFTPEPGTVQGWLRGETNRAGGCTHA